MSSQNSTSLPTSAPPIEISNPTTKKSSPSNPLSDTYDDNADPDIDTTLEPSSFTVKEESPLIGGFDGTNDNPKENGERKDAEGGIETKLPMQKDITLQEFLGKMDDYAPIIPDAVTTHHLTLAGLPTPPTTPLPLARLLALATQKFVADIAADAYQYSRMRAGNSLSTTTAPGIPGVSAGGGTGPIQLGGAEGGKGKVGQHVLGQQRAGYGGGGGGSTGRAVLTMEDLGCAVGEYGVNVKRGEFYR
ncbi:MAG: hypothetical protein Q9178_007012 [Gyalolechia marmorata]